MKHYTYRIQNSQTSQFYIGVRSCRTEIAEDYRYRGSSSRLKTLMAEDPDSWEKIILEEHPTREIAEEREFELTPMAVLRDPLCVNRARGGTGWKLMVPRGPMSEEHKEKLRLANTGRKLRKLKSGPRKKHELSPERRAELAANMSAMNRGKAKGQLKLF